MRKHKVFFFFDAPRKPLLAWLMLCITYAELNIWLGDGTIAWIVTVFTFCCACDCLTIRHITLLEEGLSKKIKSEYGYTSEEIVDEAISRYRLTWPYYGILLLNIGVSLIASIAIISIHHGLSASSLAAPVNP
jgi:hypothetical protein